MMKKLQIVAALVLFLAISSADMLFAQQEVTIRDLNTYDTPLTSQADLPGHPLNGVEVTFDAVVIGYPKNSGLASITDAGVPGRIHVFIADVSAAEDGLDGNSMQVVVAGDQRVTLEALLPGDVINVVGSLTFFNNVAQFNATDVTQLGSVFEPPYEELEFLLEPTVVNVSDLNIPSETEGQFRWNAENYTKYIFRYVKVEGVEIIDRVDLPEGRPWFITSDGSSILTSNDTSLRYRNDRTNYADGLNYNWRRLDESLDGPFTPPPAGSVVDLSGFMVVNTFNPGPGFDESTAQSTLKIAPWDDGALWVADGTDPANRVEPEGWPNDLVVLGFAPVLDNFTVTPDGDVFSDDNVTLNIDVFLPDESYTFESVVVEYEALGFDDDSGDTEVVEMTSSGDTWSYTFDTFDDFTTVNYTIIASVQTGEGVTTTARQNGSFTVVSDTQTSPVSFSPGSGTYQNAVVVTLSSATDGASIFYTTDGSDPSDESEAYTSPLAIDSNTTLKAVAFSAGLDPSPIATREYVIEVDANEVATLSELRSGSQDGTEYLFTGDAVVVYARSSRNQKYIMDESAGVLIDDAPGVITSEYNIGNQITNLLGTLGAFNGVVQFNPALNPGESPGTVDVQPEQLSLSDLTVDDHESKLVFIENVTFEEDGVFSAGTNYTINDPSGSMTFRTNFAEANYLGDNIPTGAVNITAIVGSFNGTLQLTARFSSDFTPFTDIPADDRPIEFSLNQNYPNPFNPATNISYSLANVSDVNLVVYDVLGRRVATLVNARQQMPGMYNVSFDASRLASGTYIYRLEAGDFVSIKKMLLVK